MESVAHQSTHSTAELKLACVLIAAGNSSRLGQPKQLIEIDNQSLLDRAVSLSQYVSDQTYCVLGFQDCQFRAEIKDSNIEVLINKEWREGMGSSIARGLEAVNDQFDGVLIMLCDQWALVKKDLLSLKHQWLESPESIVASQYQDLRSFYKADKNNEIEDMVLGAPAIFPKRMFSELKLLREVGARKLIYKNINQVKKVHINNATFDLDTKEDLSFFLSQKTNNNLYK